MGGEEEEEGSLPMSADPDPIKILTSDAEVAVWNSDGLPNDQVLQWTSLIRFGWQ